MLDQVNEALRNHVTRVGFDLTLGKTHIAALVWLDFMIKYHKGGTGSMPYRPNHSHPLARGFNHFAGGCHGLIDRGLVIHTHPDTIKLPRGVKFKGELPMRRFYRITSAGRLVISLLREAGIYQEYAEVLLPRFDTITKAS